MISPTLINNARVDGRLDVVKLANDIGLKVKPLQGVSHIYSDESAHIKYENNAFVIYVNPNQSRQRQRFSIAHELGHYVNHQEDIKRQGQVDRESENSLTREQEIVADKFAVDLLMPEDDLRSYITHNGLNGLKTMAKKAIEDLAKRYDVSLYAMILRLRELGFYIPYIDIYA